MYPQNKVEYGLANKDFIKNYLYKRWNSIYYNIILSK